MTRDIASYTEEYLRDYGFEKVMVKYRGNVVLEQMAMHEPNVVLEIGCGYELQYQRYLETSPPVRSWIVVEPSREFSARAREAALPGMAVVEGFLEQSLEAVLAVLPKPPDFVICTGVLQEVPSARAMLDAIRATMDQDSLLHVNVTNATSLHRRIAVAMGLIPALNTMSERSIKIQQRQVYDSASLREELETAGFTVTHMGGHFVKPFTHRQMESIAPVLGDAVLDGLFELGKREPDLASEIFANARLS